MFKHELGQSVIDVVSGYKGILNARMEIYKGPTRYVIQARVGEDGKEPENITVDEDAVEILEGEKTIKRPHKDVSFKYELGSKVKDTITGYKGIVVSRTEWLFGCMRYVIQSRKFHEGKPVGAISVDEQSVELIEVAVQEAESAPVKKTGGTGPKPSQHRTPEQHGKPTR